MKFTPLYAFTLTLTEDEVNGLLKELEEMNKKYFPSLGDLYFSLDPEVEFCKQYNKRSASALKDAIQAIPYDKRGPMLNQLHYEISLTF